MAGMNEETKQAVLDYYANLLILQYRCKPKARAHIKELIKNATGDFLFYRLYEFFDVDTAVGAQLDIIGKIVGAQREVLGLTIDKKYFSYESAPDPNGFNRAGNIKKDVLFKNRRNSKDSVYTLLDPDYRSLIKFKIVSNHAKASMEAIDDAIFDVFGNDATVINNKNMTITYMITAANVPGLLAAYKLGYLPRPNGVGVDLILNVPNPNLIFGFKRANVTYNGVGWSRAGNVKKATFLNKDNIVKVL